VARREDPTARRQRLLSVDRAKSAFLYEKVYCARGDMENRIKECQHDLFADRMPAATIRVNQLRLWFASMAYLLMCALRRIALAGTALVDATCATIRLRVLKIGALVTTSVRRVKNSARDIVPAAGDVRLRARTIMRRVALTLPSSAPQQQRISTERPTRTQPRSITHGRRHRTHQLADRPPRGQDY
jgi:hypothetical protein